MPVAVSYPGVYVVEAPSSNHVINGVTTADTAFVDVFLRGPVNTPIRISNFGEFTALFGGLHRKSRASYGVSQFFLNGGSTAWIVRVADPAAPTSSLKLSQFTLSANGPGAWGGQLQAATQETPTGIDLVVRELSLITTDAPRPSVANVEVYRGLSLDPESPNFVASILDHQSGLVVCDPESVAQPKGDVVPPVSPTDSITSLAIVNDPASPQFVSFTQVDDLLTISAAILGNEGDPGANVPPTGLYTLDSIAPFVFNLLCLPAMSAFSSTDWTSAFTAAYEYCQTKRAFFLVDYPNSWDSSDAMQQVAQVQKWFIDGVSNQSDCAAIYFPRLSIPDPLGGGIPTRVETSGTVAGLFARTDANRGVWKAPAGTDATLNNVIEPLAKVNDTSSGTLNELGINAIRTFPVVGTVSWGARTLNGADVLSSPWKYVNIRRLALFMEQSLQQGTAWAVFEPNAEQLWSALRLSVGSFMNTLFRQGAFAGSAASSAYFVQCDASTTTSTDQQLGRVNIKVGFAPLYPAEFVILTISQMSS